MRAAVGEEHTGLRPRPSPAQEVSIATALPNRCGFPVAGPPDFRSRRPLRVAPNPAFLADLPLGTKAIFHETRRGVRQIWTAASDRRASYIRVRRYGPPRRPW